MRKRLIVILAFAAAGCAHDLTAPLSSVPVTSMADYFWTAGTSESFDSDRIATYDSIGALIAADTNSNTGTLHTRIMCHISPDSVTAEHFEAGSLLDLDKSSMFIAEGVNATGSRYPGSVLLLKSDPLIDSAWPMGVLMTSNYTNHAIEARFLARLDTLTVHGVAYRDVLVIRYAQESGPQFAVDSLGAPYWVIYYARGRGPIMFDKVNTPSNSPPFERRAILP